jgi:hypothetical protein
MKKIVLINKEQLASLAEHLEETNGVTKSLAKSGNHNNNVTDRTVRGSDNITDLNDPKGFKAYLDAFDKILRDSGYCQLNEEEMVAEGMLDTLKDTFKKGIVIASAAIALGVLTPQEAKAQFKSSGDSKLVQIFKDKAKHQCKQVGKQKKTASDKQKPTSGVSIYVKPPSFPKFDNSKGRSIESKYFVKDKTGEFKEITAKQLEKIKKRKNISTRKMEMDDYRDFVRKNRK